MRKLVVIIFVSVLLLIIATGLSVFLVLNSGDHSPCLTQDCVKISNELASFIDKSVEPCNDFYQFACGNYLEHNKKENEKSVQFDIIGEMEKKLEDLLEEPISYHDGHTTKILKSFYNSCMNDTILEQVGLTRILWLLQQVGGWPVLEDITWSEQQFDWKKITLKLRSVGAKFDIFFSVSHEKKENDNQRIISIQNKKFTPYNDRKLQHEFMVDIADMLGARRPIAERDIVQVMNLHSKLVQATNFTSEDTPYTPRTIRELQKTYPSITLEFLASILYPLQISQDEIISLKDPFLFPRVLHLINNTPKRTLANYMLYQVIGYYIDILPKQIRDRKSRYTTTLGFREQSRSEVCVRLMTRSLNIAMIGPYFQKYYPDYARRELRAIVNDVKDEYKKVSETVTWLDKDTKKLIQEKLAGSEDYVTIDEWSYIKESEAFFREVRVNDSDALDSLLKMEFALNNFLFLTPTEKIRNYDVIKNKLVLLPTETQGLFFSLNHPQYLNYGAFGSRVANHLSELLIEGKNYDLFGNIHQWSTSETLVEYDEKLNCLANQYKNIYIPEIQDYPNTAETKQYDFGDFLSLHVAYKAYEAWLEDHYAESSLPGLPYSPKQLFWIASAVTKCTKLPKHILLIEMDSGMSPARLKVNGPLKNLWEFSYDFQCPSETKMNPPIKCGI